MIGKKFPAQVTMMTTQPQKDWIKKRSVETGGTVTESEVCRRIFAIGQEITEKAESAGWTADELMAAIRDQKLTSKAKTKRAAARAADAAV